MCTGALVALVIVMMLGRTSIQAPVVFAPLTNVAVVPQDEHGAALPEGASRFVRAAVKNDAPSPAATSAPELAASGVSPAESVSAGAVSPTLNSSPTSTPSPAPSTVSLTLTRSVPALTLALPQSWDVVEWANSQPGAKNFFYSRVFIGMMSEVLSTAHIRPDDLAISGMRGQTFERLLREVLRSDARIHYDRRAGKRGFVLSFAREQAPVTSRMLPLIVPVVAKRQFAVPSLASPAVEVLLGNQHLLFAEDRGRVFIANGLESLLRVLDQPALDELERPDALSVTVRGEAFLDDVLRLFVGKEQWPVKLVLGRRPEADAPLSGELQIGAAKMFAHLGPKLPPAVFAAIPRGVSGAAAASFAIPPNFSLENWSQLGASGVDDVSASAVPEGGMAVLWDVHAVKDAPFGAVGIVVALPKAGKPVITLAQASDSAGFHAECGDGSVWLLASSEVLLTRMREACERRAMSLLSELEQGQLPKEVSASQLFLAIDPGEVLEACYRYGVTHRGGSAGFETSESASGEGETKPAAGTPTWKQEYERAVRRVTMDAESVFRAIPAAVFFGRADKNGAALPALYRASSAGGVAGDADQH